MSDTSVKERAREAVVRQRDVSECGVACLAALVRYHGQEIGLDRLWDLSGASVEGTTLRQLLEAAEAVGLEAGGYEADLEALRSLQNPCVLHVTTEEGRPHYVVCFGTQDGTFVVGDPGSGVQEMHPAMLANRWSSRVLLTAEPTAHFARRVAEARARGRAKAIPDGREVRCFAVDSVPFGRNQLLVETATSEAPALVPSGIGRLLLSLDRFDTLENHAAACLREGERPGRDGDAPRPDGAEPPAAPDDRLEWMKRRLRRYAERGVLTTKSDVRARIRSWADDSADPSPSIAALGIPTAGRPESLRRALGSYVEDARGRAAPTRIVVMDDSADPSVREATRAAVADVHEASGEVRLFYADRDRRRTYARTLADHAGVPAETTRFALLGNRSYADTYGAPRNALLLQTVGELSVQVDDDTVADTARPPTTKSGLSLTSAPMPREWWFFDDRPDLRAAVAPSDPRVLDVHEALLGKTVARCLSDLGDEEELHVGDIDADVLGQMRDGARVTLTFAGAMGDSGRLSKRLRLLADASTHERLVEDYDAHMDTTEVLRAPVRPTITNGAGCVSMNVGIDNRGPVPPFMPVGQGEDQVFGLALKLCSDRTCRGYLPHALLHDPRGERARDTGPPQFDGYGAYGLVQHLMAGARSRLGADEETALQTLGRHLEDLGTLSPAAFADYAERRARQGLGQDVRSAERRLRDRASAPPAWKEDVRRYLQSARESVREETLSVPTDLSGSAEERRRVLRELTRRYGTLMRHWPTLRAAAADLKAGGVRIAEPV